MSNREIHLTRAAFLIAVLATSGSLFFSEVMQLPPCVLCWYQRIAMYPLVFILGLGLLQEMKDCLNYSSGLIIVGWIIALYHNLLYYKIIPDSITPCTAGVSCTSKQIEWLGFITIPLLSLVSFTVLGLILILAFRTKDKKHEEQ